MSDPVFRRLQLLFAQGVARLIGHKQVQARVLADEILPNIDRIEPYGFSYRPKEGAQTYLLFPAGDRSHGVAIIIGDKQYNMQIEAGEVALHDDEENVVHIKRGGEIVVNANTRITLKAPQIVLDGQVLMTQSATVTQGLSVMGQGGAGSNITGDFRIIGSIACNDRNIGDTHKHTGVLSGDQLTGEVED
jgi:phage baseplate assembly protein V